MFIKALSSQKENLCVSCMVVDQIKGFCDDCVFQKIDMSCNGVAHELAFVARDYGMSESLLGKVPNSVRVSCN